MELKYDVTFDEVDKPKTGYHVGMGDTNISNTVYILLFLCSDKSGYVLS